MWRTLGGMDTLPCTPYLTNVSDGAWVLLAPYLSLMREDTWQRKYPLRELFTELRSFAGLGSSWCYLPSTCRRGRRSPS